MFSINNIAIEIFNYPLSYIELIGTLFGLVSVYFATRANILTWPTGILNEVAFFFLFFQVQLYSDMLLQVFFFVITLYGWRRWRRNENVNLNKNENHGIGLLNRRMRLIYLGCLVVGTILLGALMSQVDGWLPSIFPKPAAYPFADGFTTVASVLATFLLAQKKIETWVLWIVVDVVSVALYTMKGINFVAGEYIIFLMMASYGLYSWRKNIYG